MYDIYGLGNALVDMEYRIDDGYLHRQDIAKGHMTLVDAARMAALSESVAELPAERMSGGSAANTVIAAQAMGCSTFYACKVAGDEVGRFFLRDLQRVGVDTNPHDDTQPGESGRCLVLITPDAERSMNTYLGISSELSEAEINEQAVRDARYLYVEGYLSSSEHSCAAAVRCREIAEASGAKTAFSLSDPSMVELFRDNLTRILGNGVSHLFCNEEEALSWAGTDRLDIAVTELLDIAQAVNVTLGAIGSLTATPHHRKQVPGYPVTAVDTNGAGDIYAGACLYAWNRNMAPADAARLGNFAASTLVTRYGARLRSAAEYKELLARFR